MLDEEMDRYLGRVRGLVIQVEELLAPIDTSDAHHLIDHGEPPEGLRSLAWTIVDEDRRIPRWVYDDLMLLMGDMVEPDHLPPDLEAHIMGDTHR